MMTIERPTPAQIRGARAMLDWSMLDLARAARVSISAVKRVEDGDAVRDAEHIGGAIRDALETEGVVFLFDGRRKGLLLRDG